MFDNGNIDVIYDIFVKMQLGSHPVAVVQNTFTHKQYKERHKTNNTQNNTKIVEECGPCPIFASYTLAFVLQLRKKHGKTSVRVAEECQLDKGYLKLTC
jgi:hypothetical protein